MYVNTQICMHDGDKYSDTDYLVIDSYEDIPTEMKLDVVSSPYGESTTDGSQHKEITVNGVKQLRSFAQVAALTRTTCFRWTDPFLNSCLKHKELTLRMPFHEPTESKFIILDC
eukprot:PhF_6_TR13781/c0_g1_i1/m.22186